MSKNGYDLAHGCPQSMERRTVVRGRKSAMVLISDEYAEDILVDYL